MRNICVNKLRKSVVVCRRASVSVSSVQNAVHEREHAQEPRADALGRQAVRVLVLRQAFPSLESSRRASTQAHRRAAVPVRPLRKTLHHVDGAAVASRLAHPRTEVRSAVCTVFVCVQRVVSVSAFVI